jgi:hypothetical protein
MYREDLTSRLERFVLPIGAVLGILAGVLVTVAMSLHHPG